MSEDEELELELLESELELLALSRETGTCWADSGFSLAAGEGGSRSANRTCPLYPALGSQAGLAGASGRE